MIDIEDVMIRRIEQQAWHRAGELAGQLARARSEEKEGILFDLEFERWIAGCCALCHKGP